MVNAIVFDQQGNLATGIHQLKADEALQHFGAGSARRAFLGGKLRELLDLARATGLVRRIYLFGSFASTKENPNDLDLLLILKPGLADTELQGAALDLVDHERARLRFSADVFWVREDVGSDVLRLLLGTYSIDRQKRSRGIVEVIL